MTYKDQGCRSLSNHMQMHPSTNGSRYSYLQRRLYDVDAATHVLRQHYFLHTDRLRGKAIEYMAMGNDICRHAMISTIFISVLILCEAV